MNTPSRVRPILMTLTSTGSWEAVDDSSQDDEHSRFSGIREAFVRRRRTSVVPVYRPPLHGNAASQVIVQRTPESRDEDVPCTSDSFPV
jgi:hypothetical protein